GQAVRAHRSNRGDIAGNAAGAAGVAGIEAQHAGRWRAFLFVLGLIDLGVGRVRSWAHGEVVADAAKELPQSVEAAAKRAFMRPWAQVFALSVALSGPG